MKKLLILSLLLLTIHTIEAQIGIGINPPDPSAILHVQDTAKGLLIPRMTEIQRIAILNPAEGLLVYQTNNAKGFWYFTSGQWKSLSALNNGGRSTLYLNNGITDSEAAARIAMDVGPNTQAIVISGCTNLTTVDLSMVTRLSSINISNNDRLVSVNLDNLQTLDGNLAIANNPKMTTFLASHLQSLGGNQHRIESTRIVNLNLPALTEVDGQLVIQLDSSLLSINVPALTQLPLSSAGSNGNYLRNNPVLTSILFPALTAAGDFDLTGNSHLTTINFNSLISVGSIQVSQSLISSASFPALRKASDLSYSYNNSLNTISLPVMDTLGSLQAIINSSLATVSVPALKSAAFLVIGNTSSFTSFAAPLLNRITGQFAVSSCPNFTSLSLPVLSTVGSFGVTTNPLLTSVSLPVLTTISGDCIVTGNTNLTLFSINAMTGFMGTNFNVSGNKLPSAQVNYLLNKLVTVTPLILNKTITLSQSVAAPPTGQGITDKATLVARPNTVITD